MSGKFSLNLVAAFGRVLKAGLVATVLAALAGCSGYESMAQKPIDRDYTVSGIKWGSGGITLVMFKAFENNGNLALCGAYTGWSAGDLQSRANRQMFDTSNIYIGAERIGPMSFMQPILMRQIDWKVESDQIIVTKSQKTANCVRTDKPWQDRYASQNITWQGPKRIVVVD